MMSAFQGNLPVTPWPPRIFHWLFRAPLGPTNFSVVAARFAFYSRWLIYKFMSSTARGVIALKCFAVFPLYFPPPLASFSHAPSLLCCSAKDTKKK